MNAEPFRVTLALNRPIAAPDIPMHLDSVLAWAAVNAARDAGDPEPLASGEDLPLAQRGDPGQYVWCASWFCYRAIEPPHALTITKPYELDAIARAGGTIVAKCPKKIDQGRGQYKAHVIEIPIQWTGLVCAYGIGDMDAVAALLETVPSIGKHARLGLGTIVQRTVEPWPAAERLWKLRELPWPEPGYEPIEATYRPPYWGRLARTLAWRPPHAPGAGDGIEMEKTA